MPLTALIANNRLGKTCCKLTLRNDPSKPIRSLAIYDGAFRLKFRRDRRYGLPRESVLAFYPRYFAEIARKAWGYWSVYRRYKKILNESLEAPDRWTYSDLAIAPPREEELDTLDLYTATRGGEAAVAKKRKEDFARESMRVAMSA